MHTDIIMEFQFDKVNSFKAIKKFCSHIISLKEVRNQQFQDSVKYKYCYNRPQSTRSGGITVGVHKQLQSRNILLP
ncbi:unnamed protein product [Paramecium pentaurelia]|uniref:Uncharacterized protein n=1 Tax=Paramecium pentaurelia TaxID=43138 RepID=A0A8S1SQM5_9CILI|nr:unnamed protein product [Paramecium pentaurelia]